MSEISLKAHSNRFKSRTHRSDSVAPKGRRCKTTIGRVGIRGVEARVGRIEARIGRVERTLYGFKHNKHFDLRKQ